MIDGLKLNVSGAELSALLLKRKAGIDGEIAATVERDKKLKELGEDTCSKVSIERLERVSACIQFYADHINKDEVYMLDRSDLPFIGLEFNDYDF